MPDAILTVSPSHHVAGIALDMTDAGPLAVNSSTGTLYVVSGTNLAVFNASATEAFKYPKCASSGYTV